MASSSSGPLAIVASEKTFDSEPPKPTEEKRKRKRKRERKQKGEQEFSGDDISEDAREERRRKRKQKNKDEEAFEEKGKKRKRERERERKDETLEEAEKKPEKEKRRKGKDSPKNEEKRRERKRLKKLKRSDGSPEPSGVGSAVNNGTPGHDVERISKPCFRIQNVPSTWNKDKLLDCLRGVDKSFESLYASELSLYSACSGPKKVALLKPEETPSYFRSLLAKETIWMPVYDECSGKKVFDLEVDSDFYELTPLNTPEGEIIADVVAVTGLAGHAFGSWRHRETGAMWLQDFLPKEIDCKKVRVLTYGYNTKLIGSGTVDDRFLDYRRNFIQQLENARSSEEEKIRPIIFIGHSLGGIVILQALVQAKNKPHLHKHILGSTKAIFFFGTPHVGLDTDELVEMVGDMSELGEPSSRLKLLELLAKDSESLETLRDGLSDIWDNLKVFSFYENEKTPTVQKKSATKEWKRDGREVKMVQPFSALLHLKNEIQIPISRNHTKMVKFSSEADKDYRTVVTHVSSCVKDIIKLHEAQRMTKECTLTKECEEFLGGLKAFDCQTHRDQLYAKRNENTNKWFLSDKKYKDWQHRALALLWVRGCAGCGKSVLAAYLSVELARDKSNGGVPLVAYFFCDDTDGRRKSADAILRGLLKVLLHQSPQLFQYVPSEYIKDQEKAPWDFESLWRVFECVVKNSTSPIFCLVDGLDECEEETRDIFSERIQSLFVGFLGSTAAIRFKVLITSRLTILGTRWLIDFKWEEICVNETGLGEDIKKFFRDELQRFVKGKGYSDSLKNRMQEALEIGGDGTFLWASLVVTKLWARSNSKNSYYLDVIKSFPPTVSEAYAQILVGINTENRSDARRVLQWVLTAKRPLSLTELRIAIAIDPSHNSICDMQDELQNDMERFLSTNFASLLTIDEYKNVHIRHQSLKDFLMDREEMKKFDSSDGFLSAIHSDILPMEANRRLAIDCLSYLSFKEFEDWVEEHVRFGYRRRRLFSKRLDRERLDRERLDRYPFLEYAAKKWTDHVEQKDREEVGPVSDSFWKLAQSSAKLNSCQEIYYLSNNHRLYKKSTPLQICAHHGFSICLERLLAGGADINAGSGTYGTAMFEGMKNRSEAVVRVLLGRNFDISAPIKYPGTSVKFGSALEAAAKISNGKIVEVLLNHSMSFGANKTSNIKVTSVVLIEAIKNEKFCQEVIEVLLGAVGEIEITEAVLVEVARSVYGEEVMKLLLSTPGDIKITEAVLIAAVESKYDKEVMELLLSTPGDIKITEAVLVAAAGSRYGKEVMKLLLSTPGDIKITEAVLVAAAKSRYGEEAMKLLLSTPGDIKITEAVLVAAAGSRYGKEVMKLLLSTPGDIKITEAVLVAAARSVYGEEAMKLLLSTPGDIKITEAVLVAAAGSRSQYGKEVMKLLLSTPGDIKITEAVLVAAVRLGYGKEVMEVLLSTPGDIKITEAVLVEVARSVYGEEVMKLLLSTPGDIKITEAVLIAAVESKYDKEVMELLLSTPGDIKITEAVLVAAAGSRYGKEVMKLLLSTPGDIKITEAVLVAAAKSRYGEEAMKLLLSTPGDIKITEAVLVAAAGSRYGKEVMKLLLSTPGDIKITEAVLVAAARSVYGEEAMKLLLSTPGDIKITEAVLVAAAGSRSQYGKEVMKLLLSTPGDIKITEAVLVAAAGSVYGEEAMKLLLSTPGDIKITEAVLVAAAGSWYNKVVMKLLLSTPGDIKITEAVLVGAAGSRYGKEVMKLLLSTPGDIKITEAVLVAAAGSKYGKGVMEFLQVSTILEKGRHALYNQEDIAVES